MLLEHQDFHRLQRLSGYSIDHSEMRGTTHLAVTVYTLSIALSHARENVAQDIVRDLLR